MAQIKQWRRGTAAEHTGFTGAPGEITVDTTNNTLRVHDGQTLGGTALARADAVTDMTGTDYVIAWQTPTADNNYTWYRKYKSGWVEQGGIANGDGPRQVTLPIKMADSNYFISITPGRSNAETITGASYTTSTSTTSLAISVSNINSGAYSWSSTSPVRWMIAGIAAE